MTAEVGGRRPPLQFSPKSPGFLRPSGFYFRSPAKFLQKRIRFSFNRIRDQLAQNRSEFKSVPAISRRNDQIRPVRIGRDPEIPVIRVAIHADARVNDWRV